MSEHFGCGYHLVTSTPGTKLVPVNTNRVVGHQLKVAAYGNRDAGEHLQLFVNDIAVSAHVPLKVTSFIFDAIVVVDATENQIIVQVTAPLTDTNTRQIVTQFNPLPETLVFELRSVTVIHNFQLWKLGLNL